jgi:hypothetical protein
VSTARRLKNVSRSQKEGLIGRNRKVANWNWSPFEVSSNSFHGHKSPTAGVSHKMNITFCSLILI